jgi:hypothetical protein
VTWRGSRISSEDEGRQGEREWDPGPLGLPMLVTYKLFGLRDELVHHLLTPHFFVWFVE